MSSAHRQVAPVWRLSPSDRRHLQRNIPLPKDISLIVVDYYVNELLVDNGSACAAICANGRVMTWGTGHCGGDSSSVQHLLVGVERIFFNDWAFAAKLFSGEVVTWGSDICGGDSSAVQGCLRNVATIHAVNDVYIYRRRDGTAAQFCPRPSRRSNSAAFVAELTNGALVAWGEPDRGDWLCKDVLLCRKLQT